MAVLVCLLLLSSHLTGAEAPMVGDDDQTKA